MSSPNYITRPGPLRANCHLVAWGRRRFGEVQEVRGCTATVHYRMKWQKNPRDRWQRQNKERLAREGKIQAVETKVHVRELTLGDALMNDALSNWTGGIFTDWRKYADHFENTTPTIDVGEDWRLACMADAIEQRYQLQGRKVNGRPMRPGRIGTRTKSMRMTLEEYRDWRKAW